MAVDCVEIGARHLAALMQVEICVIADQVRPALPPVRLLDAPGLAAVHLGHHGGGLSGQRWRGLEHADGLLHGALQQLLAQARHMPRAALLGHPRKETRAVKVDAVRVQAAERPPAGQIAALGVAVGVLVGLRAHHAHPALAVGRRQRQPALRQPGGHIVGAVVGEANRAGASGLGGAGHHAHRRADLAQRELAVALPVDQARHEPVAPRLEIDRPGQAEVSHRVARAGVSEPCGRDGADCCGELGLAGLLAESVAPLIVAGGRLHDPRRRQGRLSALGADVVQHHH